MNAQYMLAMYRSHTSPEAWCESSALLEPRAQRAGVDLRQLVVRAPLVHGEVVEEASEQVADVQHHDDQLQHREEVQVLEQVVLVPLEQPRRGAAKRRSFISRNTQELEQTQELAGAVRRARLVFRAPARVMEHNRRPSLTRMTKSMGTRRCRRSSRARTGARWPTAGKSRAPRHPGRRSRWKLSTTST